MTYSQRKSARRCPSTVGHSDNRRSPIYRFKSWYKRFNCLKNCLKRYHESLNGPKLTAVVGNPVENAPTLYPLYAVGAPSDERRRCSTCQAKRPPRRFGRQFGSGPASPQPAATKRLQAFAPRRSGRRFSSRSRTSPRRTACWVSRTDGPRLRSSPRTRRASSSVTNTTLPLTLPLPPHEYHTTCHADDRTVHRIDR